MRARASLLFGGTSARHGLTESGLETPAPTVDNVARLASPAPVTSARLHGEAAGGARQGRRRGRRGCGGGEAVVHEEAQADDDDVLVTV